MPGRVRGLGLSVPGTVLDGYVLDAVNLGWRGLDVRAVWPRAALLVAENDATLAALAESRRGVASDALLHVHVRVEAGLGGAVVSRGMVISGSRGVAGEFGHMPFGDPAVSCPCGAAGCWGTAVDGTAMARLLAKPAPADPVTYARQVLARARAGSPGAERGRDRRGGLGSRHRRVGQRSGPGPGHPGWARRRPPRCRVTTTLGRLSGWPDGVPARESAAGRGGDAGRRRPLGWRCRERLEPAVGTVVRPATRPARGCESVPHQPVTRLTLGLGPMSYVSVNQ